MPELPEVEAVVRKLRKAVIGAGIAGVQVIRARAVHPQNPARLSEAAGHRIGKVERVGKNIVVRLDAGVSLRVHLRLTGNLTVIPHARLHTSTVRVVLRLQDGRGLVLDDRRLLGSMNICTEAELRRALAKVGVDPLSAAFTTEFLVERAKRSAKPAKVFLMDQNPIAGLGNIYAAEALFRARMNPTREINSFRRPKLVGLYDAIRSVLKEAIPEAVRTYKDPGHHEGMHFRVYNREDQPCVVCGTPIARIEQAGRSTYFCPRCQR